MLHMKMLLMCDVLSTKPVAVQSMGSGVDMLHQRYLRSFSKYVDTAKALKEQVC
jgi:hypothetical protein